MGADAVEHGLADDLLPFGCGERRGGFGIGPDLGDGDILNGGVRSAGVDPLIAAGGCGQAGDFWAGEEGLDLGGEAAGPAVIGEIERFDAVGVAREQEGLLAGIPQGEGVHAAQVVEHGFAFFGIKVQEDFGVGFGAEDAALGFETLPKWAVVVDFAIEADDELAVGAGHGLRGAFAEVDDGEPPMAEADALVGGNPFALPVRPPRGHVVAYAAQFFPVDRKGRVVVGINAGYATHGVGCWGGFRGWGLYGVWCRVLDCRSTLLTARCVGLWLIAMTGLSSSLL